MSTIANTSPTASAKMATNSNVDCFSTNEPWYGRRDTTEVKIRIDIPLPIPRWVISSLSHITSAHPVVHVKTIINAR